MAEQQQLMRDLQIMGPPTFCLSTLRAAEQRTQRITGEVSASEFYNSSAAHKRTVNVKF